MKCTRECPGPGSRGTVARWGRHGEVRGRRQLASESTTPCWVQAGNRAGRVALDPAISPGGVLRRQPQDQPAHSGAVQRPPVRWRRDWVQRRVTRSRCHRTIVAGATIRSSRPAWASNRARGLEHRSVGPGQPQSADLAAEHGSFVSEQQDLRVFRHGTSGQQPQPGHELPEDEIDPSYRHDRRSCLAALSSDAAGHGHG